METTIVESAPSPGPAISPEGVAEFIGRFRAELGLPQKPDYGSNFEFDSPVLESLHVLRIEFDDIFLEIERASEPATRAALPAGR